MRKLLLLSIVLFAPLASSAAPFDGILLSTAPENPGPGDRVTVTASFVGGDVAGSIFTWSTNGDVVSEGLGATTFTLDAPALGESSEVGVSVVSNGKLIGSGTITIQPADVTIEWEGMGAVPPFYKGRPLLTAQGTVRATAIPMLVTASGARVQNQDILYTWKVNNKVDARASGYGKSTITVTPPFYDDPFILSVIASTRAGTIRAEDGKVISPRPPQLVIYEYAPLGGLESGRAVSGAYQFSKDEVSFIAYPLFVESAEALNISWSINNTPVELDTGDPRLAIFKKTGSGEGSYRIGVSYSSITKFLHHASQSFLLNF